MNLTNLSQDAIRGLREIQGPARYLYPGPEVARTGPIEQSVLLLSPLLAEQALNRPGFHHLYRLLQRHAGVYVEHTCRPDRDFLEMAEARDLDPWSLHSRRSVFSFPTWFVYLSGPSDWLSFRTLLSDLSSLRPDAALPDIILHARDFPSFFQVPTPEPVQRVILERDEFDTPEQLGALLNDLHPEPRRTAGSSTHESPLPDDPADPLRPIPSMNNNVEDTIWIGDPFLPEWNRSLSTPSELTPPLDPPLKTVDRVERLLDTHGARMICLASHGSPDQVAGPSDEWTLEFAQRFCSRFPNRPVSYRLDNPHPEHPIWTYDHLLEHYSNESLHVHLGDVRSPQLPPDPSSGATWLNHYLSGGGPKMIFSATLPPEPDDDRHAKRLIEELSDINKRAIDEKGQLFIRLQPALDERSGWQPGDVLEKRIQSISSSVSSSPVSIDLERPDEYEVVRDTFLGTDDPNKHIPS